MFLAGRFILIVLISFNFWQCKPAEKASIREATGVFSIPSSISLIDSFDASLKPIRASGMIRVPAGKLTLHDFDDTPITVYVKSFLLDSTEVTVKAFASFVHDHQYITDAEKFGNASVFDMVTREWSLVDSASWIYPKGKKQAIQQKSHDNDPVTQISWYDARAYCKSQGKRLPNELEWEHAARNGSDDPWLYSWGDEWSQGDTIFGNVWQGDFPFSFANMDGYESVAPVGSFRSSPLGFKDLSGNVWEWCDNWRFNYDQLLRGQFVMSNEKVIRGGSFLCSPNYCHGYRVGARQYTTPESSLFHVGCRCAKDIE